MLLSVKPLKVAVYKRFWLRFANLAFDLTELDNANKHFTVNNYNDSGLLQMYCHDFITKFDGQYPEHPWEQAERRIFSMILQSHSKLEIQRQVKSCRVYPCCVPGGRCMEPQLLEVNYGSDCKRACEYYPDFFNDVLSVMFLDEMEGHNVEVLE
ncbi:Tubulin--tyrosine ligase-like protein 12 [Portunus trituberculatus]|uniref:Tubulin--tyrosine ligase-like protein 12 n=1 Tax=Portunus trituberculatus TaxID=210409 RepID=A0A5B7G5V6_PORTR|nr:Tubulin--tyrosine ligase-like protein 12 [Portunus trituberculatus]